jgi:hypothetical protein
MKKLRLLIVATRGSAPKDKMPDDEYCAQWGMGLSSDQKFKWCCTEKVALLVLHGYNGADLKDAIADAVKDTAKDRPDDAGFEDPVLFYYHSTQEVGLPQFEKDEVLKPEDIAAKLKASDDGISQYLNTRLSSQYHQSLNNLHDEETLRDLLHSEINRIIGEGSLYEEVRFRGVALRDEVKKLLKETLEDKRLKCLNRKLLEDAYGDAFTQAPPEVDLICRQVAESFQCKDPQTWRYSSRGGLAIEELIRDIRDNQLTECRENLIEAIECAAAGRTIFVGKLRNIQSVLIRLRLFLEIARTKPSAVEIETDLAGQILAALRQFKSTVEGSKGRFKEWLKWTTKTGTEREKDAVKILRYPGGGEMPPGILAPNTWIDLGSSTNFWVSTRENPAGVVSDIRLFARALDILIEASEHYPHTLSVFGDDKKKESP